MTKIKSFIAILCCGILFCMCGNAFAKKAEWRTDESEKYLKWWDRTYKGTDSAVLGGILYQKGEYEEAIDLLEQSIENGSADGRVYYQLAFCYQQTGMIDKAIVGYQKAIESFGSEEIKHRYGSYSYYNLALLLKDKEKNSEAIEVLSTMLGKYPNNTEAHNLLGWLYWKGGYRKEAIEEYKESVDLVSEQENAQYNLGILYYNEGKVKEAQSVLKKVLQLNPDNKKTKMLVDNLENKDLLDASIYSQLDMPDPALYHCYLAKKHFDKKEYEKAGEEYDTAIELNPLSLEAHYGAALTYEYNHEGIRYGKKFFIEKSIFHYHKVLWLNPEMKDAIFNIAVLMGKKGDVRNSIRFYLRLLREDPNWAQAHYNLAVLFDNQTKEYGRARRHYMKYLELDPTTDKKAKIKKRLTKLIK